MEPRNLKRVDEAVDEMRSHVEDLEQRRAALDQRTEEARRQAERYKEAGPEAKALEDDDKDQDTNKDAAEEASPKDG